MNSVEIASDGVVRVILQYLKENSLTKTFQTLQQESGVHLACVENKKRLLEDVAKESVLERVLDLCGEASLPQDVLFDVFEHVASEVLETNDKEAFDLLLAGAPALFEAMATKMGPRFRRLQWLRGREKPSEVEIWGDRKKLKRRKLILNAVLDHVEEAPAGRLLSLVGLALTALEAARGAGARFDILTGRLAGGPAGFNFDVPPVAARSVIKVGKKDVNEVLCAAFSPDGRSLATGDSQGEVNVWLWFTGSLRTDDLEYQRQDLVMSHASDSDEPVSVTTLAFSRDGAVLATGDATGTVKVWHVATGKVGRKLAGLHTSSVNSIQFHPSEPQLLTASNDQTVKLTHLRNGTVLQVFAGHEGFVRAAVFEGAKARHVLTGCDDGFLRTFSIRTGERLLKFPVRPARADDLNPAVRAVISDGQDEHRYFVSGAATADIFHLDSKGALIETFTCPVTNEACFNAIAASAKAEWLVGILSDGSLALFRGSSTQLVHRCTTQLGEGRGVVFPPAMNVLAIWGNGNELFVMDGG